MFKKRGAMASCSTYLQGQRDREHLHGYFSSALEPDCPASGKLIVLLFLLGFHDFTLFTWYWPGWGCSHLRNWQTLQTGDLFCFGLESHFISTNYSVIMETLWLESTPVRRQRQELVQIRWANFCKAIQIAGWGWALQAHPNLSLVSILIKALFSKMGKELY